MATPFATATTPNEEVPLPPSPTLNLLHCTAENVNEIHTFPLLAFHPCTHCESGICNLCAENVSSEVSKQNVTFVHAHGTPQSQPKGPEPIPLGQNLGEMVPIPEFSQSAQNLQGTSSNAPDVQILNASLLDPEVASPENAAGAELVGDWERNFCTQSRSYAPVRESGRVPPGRLTPNSPRSRGTSHGKQRLVQSSFASEGQKGNESVLETPEELPLIPFHQDHQDQNSQGSILQVRQAIPSFIVNATDLCQWLQSFQTLDSPRDQIAENTTPVYRNFSDGHSEFQVQGGETFGEARDPPPYVEKREREAALSDPELSPKRIHTEASHTGQDENMAEQSADFSNANIWDEWAMIVDNRLHSLEIQDIGLHQNVEKVTQDVQGFLQNVQERIEGTLTDYNNAIARQLAGFRVEGETLKAGLFTEFQEVALHLQEDARTEVLKPFSAHALENGNLWRGLVNAQSQEIESLVKTRIEKERKALLHCLKDEFVALCKTEVQSTFETRIQQMESALRTDFAQQVNHLTEKVIDFGSKLTKLESAHNHQAQKFAAFTGMVSQRQVAVDEGLKMCYIESQKALKKSMQTVQDPQVQAVRDEISRMNQHFSSDAIQKAQTLGEVRAQVSSLERSVNGMQFSNSGVGMAAHRPEVVVVAPAVVPVHVSHSSNAPPPVAPPPPLPDIEVVELLPLEGEGASAGFSMMSVQDALLQCLHSDRGAVDSNEIEIRPVEVGNPHPSDGFNLMNLPIASHLSRSQTAPQFSNKKEDWNAFIRKFDTWSRVISSGRELSGQENLQLLLSCLPECLKREMQLWEHERGRPPTFVELRAYLEAKFARAQSESMRKKWLDVQIPKAAGKITAQHFDEFRVNFKLAMADVLDVTPEEARRVLREKLPPFMNRWVVESEAKKMKNRPLVELVMKDGLSAMAVQTAVCRWVGMAPLRVDVKGGGVYLVQFGDERIAKKLTEFHGRMIGNFERKIQVRVVEQHLGVDEIFYEVAHQMETQEKTAEFPRKAARDYQVCKTDVKPPKFDKGKGSHHPQSAATPSGGAAAPSPPVPSQIPSSYVPQKGGGNSAAPAVASQAHSSFNPSWGYQQHQPNPGMGKGKGNLPVCFNCQGYGHFSRDCPSGFGATSGKGFGKAPLGDKGNSAKGKSFGDAKGGSSKGKSGEKGGRGTGGYGRGKGAAVNSNSQQNSSNSSQSNTAASSSGPCAQ